MAFKRVIMGAAAVVLAGCAGLEPVLPKPVTADECMLFVFRDPIKVRRKLTLAFADDTSVELHDYMYTKVNQPVGDHRIFVTKGLSDDLNSAFYTYSCLPRQKYYFALMRAKPTEDQDLEDAAVNLVPIHSDEAFNRLQHFRFRPSMMVSKGEKPEASDAQSGE